MSIITLLEWWNTHTQAQLQAPQTARRRVKHHSHQWKEKYRVSSSMVHEKQALKTFLRMINQLGKATKQTTNYKTVSAQHFLED